MYAIKNGLLSRDGAALGGDLSPNKGGALAPTLLVIHYTGSPSFEGAQRTLCDGKAANRVSAHVLIGEDGRVVQLVPFTRVAWHAGVSEWRGRKGCNAFSVGIELVNSGLLGKLASGAYYDRLSHRGVPAEEVEIAAHKHGGGSQPWEIFKPPQIAAAIEVATAICRAYGIAEIVGHDDIAPGRKIDPGPAFPMVSFVARVLGRGGEVPPPTKKAVVKSVVKPVAPAKRASRSQTRKGA
jgi:N-acetylmuramoyl-L-alanine amidase